MSPRTVRTNVTRRPRRPARGSAPAARSRSCEGPRSAPRADRAARDGHRCGRPCRLAHRHALRHRADRGMRVVGGREAAAGDEDVRGVADHQGPIGDADSRAVGQVPPDRVGADPVVLDRARRTGRSRRRIAGAPRTSSRGQPVVAVHAPRLADPDARPERDQRRPLVAGHPVDEEPDVLERLSPAGDLGLGQEPRVRRVDDPAVVARAGTSRAGS